jgi:hypothetical protein
MGQAASLRHAGAESVRGWLRGALLGLALAPACAPMESAPASPPDGAQEAPPLTGSLRGRLVQHGRPVAPPEKSPGLDASLNVYYRSLGQPTGTRPHEAASSDADDDCTWTFAFDDLPTGPCELQFLWHEFWPVFARRLDVGVGPQALDIEVPRTSLRITLEEIALDALGPGRRLEGLAGFWDEVRLSQPGAGAGQTLGTWWRVGEDLSRRFEWLQPGAYSVVATTCFGEKATGSVTLVEDRADQAIVLALRPKAHVTGQILAGRAADGVPRLREAAAHGGVVHRPASVQVHPWTEAGPDFRTVLGRPRLNPDAANGTFTLDVPPGEHVLALGCFGLLDVRRLPRLEPGSSRFELLEVDPLRDVRLRYVDARGQGVELVRKSEPFFLTWPSGVPVPGWALVENFLEEPLRDGLRGTWSLPPGRYSLRFVHDPGAPWSFEVRPGHGVQTITRPPR